MHKDLNCKNKLIPEHMLVEIEEMKERRADEEREREEREERR